jgi:hypothetical protein
VAEYMGKVVAVKADETIDVRLFSGGFKTRNVRSRETGIDYKVLHKGPNGKPIRKASGLTLQFLWSEVRNGPVRPGDTVMVDMQPVRRPVRKV